MANPKLSPCPFCGHVPEDWPDFLHRTGGGWRDDILGGRLTRHYMRRDDPRGIHGEVWELGCLTHEGGCGATVSADSRDEAIAAWNRRPGQPSDLLDGQAELTERVAFAIHRVIKPSNLTDQDWTSGAELGYENSYRNQVKQAAQEALACADHALAAARAENEALRAELDGISHRL